MGRLSKAQIIRREACKKGGRGKKIPKILKSPIITPIKPKTTAWRHKKRAAISEQALHDAALNKIMHSAIDTGGLKEPSGLLISEVSSEPVIWARSVVGSTGHSSTGRESIAATAGSILNTTSDSVGSEIDHGNRSEEEDEAAIQLRLENGEDFEDIDEMESILDPLLPVEAVTEQEFGDAVQTWPRGGSPIIRRKILEKGFNPHPSSKIKENRTNSKTI